MGEADQTKAVTSANLEAWNEVSDIHARHNQAKLLAEFRKPGHSCLDDIETARLEAIGVVGKDVAQICCNNGRELLSVKNMGAARCVGFDGAQGFIDQARELAEAAGQDVEFVCTNIYDIEESYQGSFDLVTITIGVISWMPDLNRFFAVVTGLLSPGGALFIYEQHPLMDMIKPGKAGDPVIWELPYFDAEPYVDAEGLDYFGGEEYDAKPATSYSHTTAQIIMACVGNGLSVEHFEELPGHISNTWYNVEASEICLPMSYTLVMRKAG